jgi:hypothetical protein
MFLIEMVTEPGHGASQNVGYPRVKGASAPRKRIGELVRAWRPRYLIGYAREKTKILNGFVALTGYYLEGCHPAGKE